MKILFYFALVACASPSVAEHGGMGTLAGLIIATGVAIVVMMPVVPALVVVVVSA
jgi:hypothetical protein